MAAFRIDDSKRLGSRRVTPMCAVHNSFLLTLLTMSNTIGFAKKRVISKTAVPTMFPSKRAVSQRSLSQPLDAEGRLGLAAGPDSERRAQVNKSSSSSSSSLGRRCVPWLGEGLIMPSQNYPLLCFPLPYRVAPVFV